MSDLVTTAIATGGTSFDTATCIGGHKQDPFKIYGASGVLYEHDMLQTKTEYQSLELNTTMDAYNASTNPSGAKPNRSPFADDSDAYFVGDTNFQDAGSGLVRFKRTFSRIPTSYEIPYGLYSRTMPEISAHSATTTLTTGFNTSDSFVGVMYTNTTSEANDSQFFIDNVDSSSVVRHKLTFAQINSGYSYSFGNPDFIRVGLPSGSTTHINSNTKYRYVIKGVWASGFNGSIVTNMQNGISITFPSALKGQFAMRRSGYSNNSSWIYDLNNRLLNLIVVDSDSNGFTAISTSAVDWIGQKYSQGYTQSEDFCWGEIDQYDNSGNLQFEALGFSSVTTLSSSGGLTRTQPIDENMPAKVSYRFVKADSLDGLTLANKYLIDDEVDSTSTPTRDEYLELVSDGTFVASEVEFLERYLGNIYKIGQIKTQLK